MKPMPVAGMLVVLALAACGGGARRLDSDVDRHYAALASQCQGSAEIRQRVAVSSFPVHSVEIRLGANPDVYESCMRAAGDKTVIVEVSPQ